MTLRLAFTFAGFAAWLALAAPAGAGPRVFSIGQCADEYVMALAPRADIVGVSYRADDFDSYLRDQARGLPQRRDSLESILASRAQLVVRYWPKDDRLARSLQSRGVRIVTVEDATDFNGVRGNVRKVAGALRRGAQGEALIARMDAQLAAARGAWRGAPGLYLTSGGFTAGGDTLIGAMMTGAGMHNLAPGPSFAPAPLERMVISPPKALVLGFFDKGSLAGQSWSLGRHDVIRRLAASRTIAALPPTILGCPAWFAADGARDLAAAARARR